MTCVPYYQDELVRLHLGDCLDILPELSDNSVDAVVTDPPYGLEFMGKEWDKFDTRTHYRDEREGIGYPKTKAPRWSPRDSKRLGAAQDASRNFGEWCEQWAAECLRILRPGGHLLAFGGTRTSHRLACAIEDAGFEIRDSIAWLYGSGFPKSLDVSKAIDKRCDWSLVERLADEIRRARAAAGLSLTQIGEATMHATGGTYGRWYHRGGHMFFETGRSLPSRPEWEQLRRVLPIASEFAEVYDEAEREVIGRSDNGIAGGTGRHAGVEGSYGFAGEFDLTAPATPEAEQWQGWGTALKPAHEPIVVARKPLTGTVAANVLRWGTGALNIDASRIESGSDYHDLQVTQGGRRINGGKYAGDTSGNAERREQFAPAAGRWPANVALDESQAAALDQMSGESVSLGGSRGAGGQHGMYEPIGAQPDFTPGFGDTGGASRFFYTAKASSDERITHNGVSHPTVKPLALMRWLVRLVCPPGGTILDPFAGSGTTVEAAILEGFRCVAVERGGPPGTPEAEYLPMITQRINRRRDPIAYLTAAGEDLGLFGGVA